MMVNEKSQADGLRARVISYMCSHFSDYADVDEHTLNADLPPWIHFSTVEKRIAAMAEPQSLPGELEICATSKVLNKQIIVINSNNVVIQRSGQGDNSPLIVQFTSFGEDVGHYDCVIKNTAPTETSSTTSNPNESIMEIINDLSPIPKMQPKRKSAGRKREVAEVLTSSPYKAKLVERQAKKKATEEKKKVAKEKKKVAESRNKPKAGNSKTKARKGKRRRQESDEESSDENEEWPCLVCGELFCNSRSRETWVQVGTEVGTQTEITSFLTSVDSNMDVSHLGSTGSLEVFRHSMPGSTTSEQHELSKAAPRTPTLPPTVAPGGVHTSSEAYPA
ncbi:hypothetical protein ACOMHN_044508 [Nucella lapillus]